MTALATYGVSNFSRIKEVNNKPVSFFNMDDGTYGVLSHYSSRFADLRPGTISTVDIAYHVFAIANAQILSSGTSSMYAFFSIGIPDDEFDDFIMKSQEGIKIAASLSGTLLIGGDVYTSHEPEIDVLLCGIIDKKTHLSKKSVKGGYNIYVSGHPGDEYAGREILNGSGARLQYERTLVNRYLKPTMYNSSILNIMDELKPVFISTCAASVLETLIQLCTNQTRGFTINYHQFPVSAEMLQFFNNDRKAAFTYALTKPCESELLIITNKSCYTSEYIDDAYISCIGKITDSGHFIGTHNAEIPFNPKKTETITF